MDLTAYFDRIGYSGPTEPDLATLAALMQAHLAAIPFENLDVQLGRPLTPSADAAFAKLVGARRGGWCFEQNGVFGAVLSALGYDVQRLACAVMRAANTHAPIGDHLALKVTIDGAPWLVDVGFGGSQSAPLPLAPGSHDHAPYRVELSEAKGWWRFTETIREAPFSYDFRDAPPDEAQFATRCAWLASDPTSNFTVNLVAKRRQGDRLTILRGRILSTIDADGEQRRLIASAEELVEVLKAQFGLDVPEIARVWEKVRARHDALFADDGTALAV